MQAVASVIIRTYNSANTLPATLAAVREQTVPAEIVVVDSGSSDQTLALAGRSADRVVHLPRETFSYGRALNVGAAAATAPWHASLSSHTLLPHPEWLATAVGHLEGGAVAACGAAADGEHVPLTGPLRADREYLRRYRYWGFTNTASVWSPDVWRAHPFDESLVASEDQEWSWRAVQDGGYLVADPELLVSGSHRRRAGLRAYHRRMVAEIRALEHLRPLESYTVVDAVADWARVTPRDPFISRTRRLRRTRLLDVTARWEAGAQSRRGRSPQPRVLAPATESDTVRG